MNTQPTITEQVSALKDKVAQSRGHWKQRLPDNVFYPLNNAVLLTEKIEYLLEGLRNELLDALYNMEKGGGTESGLAKTIEELANNIRATKEEQG